MGTDKALLAWGNSSLLSHQFNTLEEVVRKFKGRAFVSGDRPGFPSLLDLISDQGPLAGLQSVFKISTDGALVLVMPVDMPELDGGLLERLIRSIHDADCVQYEGFELPLAIRISEKTRGILAQTLGAAARSDRSVWTLLSRLEVLKLSLESHGKEQFRNLNFIHEYHNARGG